MKKTLLAFGLLLTVQMAFAADRFGRPVIKVKNPQAYKFFKSDDIEYPVLSNEHVSVACMVYRGKEHYYVEVSIQNKTTDPVTLPPPGNFITFDKPGYTSYRIDTMVAARQAASAGGIRFTPTPPPYIPPTYNTTINATATNYGNQTNISGTATTTTDNSGQAGANIGNAIGNAIAAHRFYKAQRTEVAFSHFLTAHIQTDADMPLPPAQWRTVVATFEQAKQKKKPFTVTVAVGVDNFRFEYNE